MVKTESEELMGYNQFFVVCWLVCLFLKWGLCSPDCPGIHYVHVAGFELRTPWSARIKGTTLAAFFFDTKTKAWYVAQTGL